MYQCSTDFDIQRLDERPAERLHYLGVSFGLTGDLFNFWLKSGYLPVYVRLTVVCVCVCVMGFSLCHAISVSLR